MPEPTFNVLVSVVELVDAATPADAIAKMTARLQAAGFSVYGSPDAFESED